MSESNWLRSPHAMKGTVDLFASGKLDKSSIKMTIMIHWLAFAIQYMLSIETVATYMYLSEVSD